MSQYPSAVLGLFPTGDNWCSAVLGMDFKVPIAFCQYKSGVTDQAAFPLAERICQDRNSQRPQFPPGCELLQGESEPALILSALGLTLSSEILPTADPSCSCP